MTDNARGLSWYALKVRSNHEKTVGQYLAYRGVDWYLPLYRQESRWSDRRKTLERVLFPGYTFVRTDNVAGALELPGVCGVLGGLQPAAIPDAEIASVRLVIASMRPLTATDYTPGELVTVTHGALKGVSGVVARVKNAVRLVVNIELLGRAVAVELDAAALAKHNRSWRVAA